ncbi:PI-PLC X domain-containing protein 1 [Anabrus simplex]|uniref:PI-PLC X domain-containing protein 1 n=1 Tax=Anabrus simplex TaxID=316456 RepID=UPI0035A3373D
MPSWGLIGLLLLLLVKDAAFSDDCGALWVSLTVSPLVTTNPPRSLHVSWGNADPLPGDWVGLLNDSSALQSPLSSTEVVESSGVLDTRLQAPVLDSSSLPFTRQCLGYWAVYVRNNSTVLNSTCLGTQPTWMEEMKDEISSKKMWELFLPGTHDSGSYKLYRPKATETLVVKYSINQEDDVLTQLVLGVRYIDLRVGYYSSTEELWWVNHGVARMRPLSKLLDSVRVFLNNTREIVILDVQEFPIGFSSWNLTHSKLVQYLQSQLEYLLASPALGWNATLGELWSHGNRLILSYDVEEVVKNTSILWQSVQQKWGDQRSMDGLYTYLDGVSLTPPSGRPTAAMAQLTPNAWGVLTDQFGGLRAMAATVSHNISQNYRNAWGRHANVVAVDFLLSTSIVDVALMWNRRRTRNITCT